MLESHIEIQYSDSRVGNLAMLACLQKKQIVEVQQHKSARLCALMG